MKVFFRKHLLNNSGDIYMYFLIFMLVIILMFSAVFGLMQLRIATNNVYNEVETAADIVLATIKKECYQSLIDGTTENSSISSYTKETIANQLAEQLNADLESDQITKKTNNQTLFIIRDIEVSYDDVNEEKSLENIDSGLLRITFNIEIPIKFNGDIIYTVNKTYTKNTTLNFK